MLNAPCPLCSTNNSLQNQELILYADEIARVIWVRDTPLYPAYLRVISQVHAAEMSDLDTQAQQHILYLVLHCERYLRQAVNPHKINLASLGNMVPHLHWHIVARFTDDAHFPQAIWASADAQRLPQAKIRASAVEKSLSSEAFLSSFSSSFQLRSSAHD